MSSRTLTSAAIVLAGFHLSANAGEFSVFCTYQNNNLSKCAGIISDIVTDKFTIKFPASKFQIFVHSNIHNYTNGGYAAYALAGVAPRGSGIFPVQYYSKTAVNGTDVVFNTVQLAELELQNYRSAVQNLMNACEISPACDVYTSRAK